MEDLPRRRPEHKTRRGRMEGAAAAADRVVFDANRTRTKKN
jgi:hypothetical protein